MPKENKKKKVAIIKHIAIIVFGLTVFLAGIWMFMELLKWDFGISLWYIFGVVFFYLLSIILVLVGIMYIVFSFDD